MESSHAKALSLSSNDFNLLASTCAPQIANTTLLGVARTESGLDTWALHDNTTGISEKPASKQLAYADATAWVKRGDSVDIGLMQINSANLLALGMTIESALNPCTSLAGGAAVLQAAYGGGKTTVDQQVALLMALSRYNTGSPLKGIMNGYARTVILNAGTDGVPAFTGNVALVVVKSAAQEPTSLSPDTPPAWNISATGAYAQSHGAAWLVSLPEPISMPSGPAAQSTGSSRAIVAPVATARPEVPGNK